MELYHAWKSSPTDEGRAEAWREILAIHAENVFSIGLVASAPQPVVIAENLRNFPEQAIYAWEPGAHFGVWRIDEVFYAE
jgi:ABC-type dipeptide transport system, periplasmic component